MKIAMIGPRWGGGITTHINELTKRFELIGNNVVLISPAHVASPLAAARYFSKLATGFDIVHVHGGYDIPALVAGFAAAKALGSGTVYTTHGTGSRYWRPGKRWGGLWRESAKRVDVIISVSDFVRQRMIQIVGENPPKHCTIYNGVDTNFFTPLGDSQPVKQRLGVSGMYVLLYLGRLASNKGLGYLLGAMPMLRKRIKNVVLIIGGVGELEGELKGETNRLGLSNIVQFRGHIPREELPEYYGASDVVLVPSTYEPGGIVPLEGMSMKRPVVGTRIGGIAEVLIDGRTGLLVPPMDSTAIAAAVLRLHDDPFLATSLGENGRSIVEEKFSWERVARETLKVYSRALAN